MRIMVGLGNPGVEYRLTRHNAGVRIVEAFSQKLVSDYGWRRRKHVWVFEGREWLLVKTESVFMNESARLIEDFKQRLDGGKDELWLVHDDLDLKLGSFKIQHGRGPKVHHGIASVESGLKSKNFWRVRIGIDNRLLPVKGEEYVLQRFSPQENEVLEKTIEKVVKELLKV